MISIIISSYKEIYYNQIISNIENTVGVPYEIVKIDNPGKFSLTEAYNIGANRAKFDVLCFLHEDIKFHCLNWGDVILKHFKTIPDLGLIGLAGSKEKLLLPTGWGYHHPDKNLINILHHDDDGNVYKISTYAGENIDFVRVIDGVFMAMRKSVWQKYKFDESVDGYHFYDIDFSLRVSQEYKVGIAYDIIIEHFSHGNFGDDWIEASIKYHADVTKQHLFDKPDDNYPLIRRSYYMLLAKNKISRRLKFVYTRELGFDFRSLPAIIAFFFPKITNPIYKRIRIILKAINKVDYLVIV